MHLVQMFNNSLQRSPDTPAVFINNQFYTFNYIDSKANKVAASLMRIGVEKQDRVIVMLKNNIENIIIFWATQKINAVYVPISLDMPSEYIKYCINDVEAKIMFLQNKNNKTINEMKLNSDLILVSLEGDTDIKFEEMVNKDSGKVQSSIKDDEDLAIILYTSGTSGRPKGVPRTHKNEYASTLAHIIQNTYRIGDSTIGAVQFYHTMGMRAFLSMVFLGGCYYSNPQFDADNILKQIHEYKITTLFLTPTHFHELLSSSKHTYNMNSIRVISYAGAPMRTELINQCNEFFNPTEFINHYGSTEIYTICSTDQVREKPWITGKAGLHSRIKIAPIKGKYRIDYESGKEIGEIIVSLDSDEAFKGYWNRPDETAKVIKNGWYHTGDIGRILNTGELIVVGRLDEMILSSGENIHPEQIEKILNNHPDVLESAVVGESDERFGEIITAYIVSENSDINFLSLDAFCKKSDLSSQIRPRNYKFIKNLPKTKKGKLNRKLLKTGAFDKS